MKPICDFFSYEDPLRTIGKYFLKITDPRQALAPFLLETSHRQRICEIKIRYEFVVRNNYRRTVTTKVLPSSTSLLFTSFRPQVPDLMKQWRASCQSTPCQPFSGEEGKKAVAVSWEADSCLSEPTISLDSDHSQSFHDVRALPACLSSTMIAIVMNIHVIIIIVIVIIVIIIIIIIVLTYDVTT